MNELGLEVNACIYCGSRGPKLTREHVVPSGLGGNSSPDGFSDALVLQRASCHECQQITSSVERRCLVTMMGPARSHLGLRRKDRRSDTTTALVDRLDGVSETRVTEWNDVPGVVVLPQFYEAPVLTNATVPAIPPCDYHFRIVNPARHVPDDARRIGVSLTADSRMFARLLAKIGLGLAVASLGTQGYEPLVRDLILRGADSLGLVGGYAGTGRKEVADEAFHKLHLAANRDVRCGLIIAEVRLFAEFNGPTNYVVVGRWV
jgi:hypothetical protein